MKNKIIIVLLASCLVSLRGQTQLLNVWRDPGTTISSPVLHKIVVSALLGDLAMRQQAEDYMVSLYPGVAVQSYLVFGTGPLSDNEADCNLALQSQGFDGIVILGLNDENPDQFYASGQFPAYYQSWTGYWHNGWVKGFDNGRPFDKTWQLQLTVFSVLENKLIWSGNTVDIDPAGKFAMFRDFCDEVHDEMQAEQFLNTETDLLIIR